MPGKLGINLDANNVNGKPDPADLGIFSWARLVARPDAAFGAYLQALQNVGIQSIVVLARESFRTPDPDAAELADVVRAYAQVLAPDCWQIGNEPDADFDGQQSLAERQASSGSSWVMESPQYAQLVSVCSGVLREVQPNARIITAGMVSGQPQWLVDCGPLDVDGVAVHPYGQRPTPDFPRPDWGFGVAGDLLDNYAGALEKPLWITEFGSDDPEVQPEYPARIFDALVPRADLMAACVFCYSDGMVAGFGVVDGAGVRKPEFEVLALRSDAVPV